MWHPKCKRANKGKVSLEYKTTEMRDSGLGRAFFLGASGKQKKTSPFELKRMKPCHGIDHELKIHLISLSLKP